MSHLFLVCALNMENINYIQPTFLQVYQLAIVVPELWLNEVGFNHIQQLHLTTSVFNFNSLNHYKNLIGLI